MTHRRRTASAVVLLLFVVLAALGGPGAALGKRTDRDMEGGLRTLLASMSLEEKVGQMFVTYAYGDTIEDSDPAMVAANRQDHGVDNGRELIEKYNLGGIIYFTWSNNVNDPLQIANLSNEVQEVATNHGAKVPAIISTDQEHGIVVRVLEPATQFPGNMALGAARKASYARLAAEITGKELRALGINQNYAPVADVNVNPANPVIGVRSFSSRSSLVSSLVGAQVRAFQTKKVASTAKHFPGHGDTDVDSHTGLPVINHTLAELDAIDLPPFRRAIDRGVKSIMTAHIAVPALDDSGHPATLSKPILTGLLRQEMGFNGVVVTDALTMEGVRELFGDDRVPIEAIKAGADQLLMPPKIDLAYNSVLDAVSSGEISEMRVDRSVMRILRMKQHLGILQDPFVDEDAVPEVVGIPAHLEAADAISERTVTLVKNEASILPLRAEGGEDVLVTGWGETTTATMADRISQRGLNTEVFETGETPSDATIEAATTKAESRDLVVVSSMNVGPSSPQQELVKALIDTGVPVIVAAVGNPYDIAYFTEADTYAATYSYQPVSIEALTKVLFGEVDPTGKLPVDVPTAEDPDEVLYPFGYGIGYAG